MKTTILYLFTFLIIMTSCKNVLEKSVNYPEKSLLVGLASAVQLNIDTTLISISDYFPTNPKIDSIELNPNLKSEIINNNKEILLTIISDTLPNLSVLNVYIGKEIYSLLLKKSKKVNYRFAFYPEGKQYKEVKVMGEFNSWNSNSMFLTFDGEAWIGKLTMEPGKYQYLLVLDGNQKLDPTNMVSMSNNMGGYNSVLTIGNIDDTQKPQLYTASYDKDIIKIGVEKDCNEIIAFYDNYQLHEINKTDTFYEITIPKHAKTKDRTYIRVWAYNNNGISNDLLIPLQNAEVVRDVSVIKRSDFEATIIYNVFVDRFFDGNPSNTRKVNDPNVHTKANYYGGDILGVTKKIQEGFFADLGVNTIWISPVVKNPEGAFGMYPTPKTTFSAYHGYWPISFTEVDNRMGTEKELKELVSTAHNKNMNVLLDFVAHHVHEQHPYYIQHPDWTTQLHLPDGTLNVERWDDYRLTTWFDVFLPTLDLQVPEVTDMLSDSAVYWIEHYDFDGFRHDATKHVPEIFWKTLTYKLKNEVMIPENKKLYQIGETYGTDELIKSYINTGELDAQFDFNLYDAIATCLSTPRSFKDLAEVLNTSLNYYGNHNLMGNITGNQDRGRFISYAGGALSYNEDPKKAGWTREVLVGDTIAYEKSKLLMAFIMTVPGIPVIYYGDEIGMYGGNDPDNRKMMRFDSLTTHETKLRNATKKLIEIRKNSLPLIFGDYKLLDVSDSTIAYQRAYFGDIAIIILNKSSYQQTFKINVDKRFDYSKLKSNFDCEFKIENNMLEITIPAYSFEVIN